MTWWGEYAAFYKKRGTFKVRLVQSFAEKIVLHIPYLSVNQNLILQMPSDKFYYSKWNAWWPYGYTAGWVPMNYYNHLRLLDYHHGRLFSNWDIGFWVLLALFLVYHFFRYLLPMLQKKPYLELDGDKINFLHKHRVIYEHEIKRISVGFTGNSLILKLKTKRKARIYLSCIRGDNGAIAQAILTHCNAENGEKLLRFVI